MVDFILSNLFWFWFAVFVLMILIELATVALVSIWCAISALIIVFLSCTGMAFKWQLLIFFLISVALILFTRPLFVKKFKLGKAKTNLDAIVDTKMVVVDPVGELKKGSVKSTNGVIWSAESESGESLGAGDVCTVVRVEGNTLVVKKTMEENSNV